MKYHAIHYIGYQGSKHCSCLSDFSINSPLKNFNFANENNQIDVVTEYEYDYFSHMKVGPTDGVTLSYVYSLSIYG